MFHCYRRRAANTLLGIMLAVSSSILQADIRLASWNVLNGGWDNDKAVQKAAHIASHFDFLALQEVMNDDFVDELERHLEHTTGEDWSWMTSHAIGRSTYREQYAFLYRDSAVEYDRGAVVFLDHRDVFAREPYSAKFRSRHTGREFAVGNIHVVYGNSVGERLTEIYALADYWEWLQETYEGTPTLLMGDFNLDPGHPGWGKMREQGVIPAITAGASTLGMAEGRWSNLYDNIWKAEGEWAIGERGILLFPELLPITHIESRARVSDHAPVYITFGTATINPIPFTGDLPASHEQPAQVTTSNCIDLNTAPASQLTQLPQIGPARANSIIDGRPWHHPRELQQIPGLGLARVKAIKSSGRLCL